MNSIFKYKGYTAQVSYSAIDNILHGKIEGVSSLVTFEAENGNDLKIAFKEAVDNYLTFCKENNLQPEKPRVSS